MIIESACIRRTALIAYGLAIVGLTLVSAAADAQTAATRVFERLDTDRDEVIEPQEIQAARHAAFDRADADNDDYVTGTELEALREGIADEYGRGRGPRARAPEGARGAAADRVKRLDTDGDGRIAETEFVAAVDPLLQRFDGNGDGSITRAEMDEGASKAREEFRQRRGTL
jgi:Ca2+-binding EF-hand superfamily protein